MGAGGGLWVQIMENECLVIRGGHGGHFTEKFVKNIVPCQIYRGYHLPHRDLAVVTRRRLAISAIISKRFFKTFKIHLLLY